MKKIISMFVILLVVLVSNIEAKSAEGIRNKSKDITTSSISEDIYFIDGIKKSFQDIEDYTDDDVIKKNNANNTVSFIYYNKNSEGSHIKYVENFKKTSNGWFNYQEIIEMGSYSGAEEAVDVRMVIDYYESKGNCKTSDKNAFVNDNCQSKNLKSIVFAQYWSNKVDVRVTYKYANNANAKINTYTYFAYEERWNDSFDKYVELYVTRNSKNQIVKTKYYQYNNKKKVMKVEGSNRIKSSNAYDYESADFNNLKITQYNKAEKVIFVLYVNSKDYTKAISYSRNSYNNKIMAKRTVKRDNYDRIYYNNKIQYKSNGKRSKMINYKYKKGKVNKRYEYVYNKQSNLKGNAYKYITTYKKNKKNKMVKNQTTKYFYNKKGKVYKSYKMKNHRSDFYTEDYFWYFW